MLALLQHFYYSEHLIHSGVSNRWQSISINRLILILDDESMANGFVWLLIGIDYQYQAIDKLVVSIGIDWL